MPCTTTIPNSARCARNAFASIVCCRIGSARVRCSMGTACWPALLTGTYTRPTARSEPGGVGSRGVILTTASKTGIEASAALGITVNMINTATNYQSGAELHFEGALNEHFPFGLPAGVGGL